VLAKFSVSREALIKLAQGLARSRNLDVQAGGMIQISS
jgi:hypothetical protein